ncbi:hypothetical protein CHT76_08445 [Listeria monocytogenes]|nr:hypothetical protein [Listeria monocytogenes]EAG8714031.1 hypothetical protein [Listeria monocytogenes]EAG8732402.1 hypothetical protein [Listeria monocytogenes]
MIIKTDSNANGNFYWDNVEKLTRLVRHGETPEFETVENPESMLHVEVPEKEAIANVEERINNLSLLSIKQLREIAKEKELNVPKTADKKKLIEAITASADNEPDVVDQ